MLNRRTFVQTLAAGTVGALTVPLDLQGQTKPKAPAAPATKPADAPPRVRPEIPPDAVRIGNNENPYGPSPAAIKASQSASPAGHRYPGGQTSKLTAALAAKHGVKPETILLSCGSGDILRAAVQTYTSKLHGLVTGLPSYESPSRQAQHLGVPLLEVPLTSELRLDLTTMAKRSTGAGLIYICNPNNPTSTVVPAAEVAALIEKVTRVAPRVHILVDEAYFEYADHPGYDTVIPLVEKHPQLIVARTFSKIHGMAGMRVGYAIAQPDTLKALKENHSSSGLSVMTLTAALESMADTATLERNRELNRAVRRTTIDAFVEAGYRVAASDANFIFVDVKRDAKTFQESCLKEGVLIGRAFPPLDTWARLSIGTKEEMDKAVAAALKVLAAPPPPPAAKSGNGDLDLPSELT